MNKATSVEDFKLVSSFESLRKTLLAERYQDRMDKPLAYWALPSDRRLPLAFLGRTIGDLLNTPFEDLHATPGIGQKKISSLIKLLARATRDEPPAVPFGISEPAEQAAEPQQPKTEAEPEKFDPTIVSEALWERWRETVRRAGLANEKLGRLAPSLQQLPTVIWHTPLSFYMDRSVDEIRRLKTHGEKRVRVVLEVFYLVHAMLAEAGARDHLAIRLVPNFIIPLERWLHEVLERGELPTGEEIHRELTEPLLAQTQIDAGEPIVQLARGRLGLDGPPQSVRMQSRRMGVTRARIYQLLDDCSKVMNVRWPDGQMLLRSLLEKVRRERSAEYDSRLLEATAELFYPRKYGQAPEDVDGEE